MIEKIRISKKEACLIIIIKYKKEKTPINGEALIKKSLILFIITFLYVLILI